MEVDIVTNVCNFWDKPVNIGCYNYKTFPEHLSCH